LLEIGVKSVRIVHRGKNRTSDNGIIGIFGMMTGKDISQILLICGNDLKIYLKFGKKYSPSSGVKSLLYFLELTPLKSIGAWCNQGFEAFHQDCRLVFTRATTGRGGKAGLLQRFVRFQKPP